MHAQYAPRPWIGSRNRTSTPSVPNSPLGPLKSQSHLSCSLTTALYRMHLTRSLTLTTSTLAAETICHWMDCDHRKRGFGVVRRGSRGPLALNGALDVTFVFVQAKSGPGFDGNEIMGFFDGVTEFFSEAPSLPMNEDVAAAWAVSNKIFENSLKFQWRSRSFG